ncbi:23S rRNA (adenine(2030)-N(6))-methyltransferase RlmJ [Motilimonas cestriensis]|uniref:Ribosomal RNA large subunit methyltransferase J n=1 Tax=Motilimonas cestriensis TaxID=2742685 RepID=A0ABS8WEC9_9GAMM|nr:23S rRNA (adenine(2030)-N(6))-methyltransferase RlmJ [Motilimonas cestriensis]MCE2596672.1 23S rRNA (adenine(2030)-N(6))-methyltransferase RlmJ [Motilimonas cestriensis]
MLSYRHSYHAGNFADVLKHLVALRIFRHLNAKPKPYLYLDTHSGPGGYALNSEHAQKTQEYLTGIAKLWQQVNLPEPLQDYVDLIKDFNEGGELAHYPGSPSIAKAVLSEHDRLNLFELHTTEIELLKQTFPRERRTAVEHGDGFKGLIAKVPPKERRGFVLIDPPYEIKSDYDKVVSTVIAAHKRFATGVYAIWYPVVERYRIKQMEQGFINSGIRNIQLFELAIKPDTTERGMTSSGMIVINPPWKLKAEMDACLPLLAELLGDNQQGFFRSEQLVPE